MKVGDSISASDPGVAGGYFLNCFDGVLNGSIDWEFNIKLGDHSALAPTIEHFKTVKLSGGADSWSRASLSARSGQTANWAVTGSPSPIDQESAATNPRFAVVMFGSNDVGWYNPPPYPVADQAEDYETSMRAVADALIAKGIIPLLTTMPPRQGYESYVPVYSGVVRAIAQGRQIPLIDYNRELMSIAPPRGLSGDGIHPSVQDYNTACWFDSTSLSLYGYNIRNLATLQALDRMRQILVAAASPPDPGAPKLAGDGSATAPFLVGSVPFGELRDLRRSSHSASGPLGCSGAPAIQGPEYLYQLVLARSTSLRVLLLDRGAQKLRVSLLSSANPASCFKSDPRLLATTLDAGTYFVAVDAPTAAGAAEYNLSVTECLATDLDCR